MKQIKFIFYIKMNKYEIYLFKIQIYWVFFEDDYQVALK